MTMIHLLWRQQYCKLSFFTYKYSKFLKIKCIWSLCTRKGRGRERKHFQGNGAASRYRKVIFPCHFLIFLHIESHILANKNSTCQLICEPYMWKYQNIIWKYQFLRYNLDHFRYVVRMHKKRRETSQNSKEFNFNLLIISDKILIYKVRQHLFI